MPGMMKPERTMKKLPKRIKVVEKSAVTNKPQPASSAKKIKITAGSASTTGGPKSTTSVSGSSISGGMKVNTGAKAAAKPTPKPTAKATKKPMTASEKAFIKNQKEKAKATKRTGVYPNTAN